MKKFAAFDIDGTLFRSGLYREVAYELMKMGVLDESIAVETTQKNREWRGRLHGNAFEEFEMLLVTKIDEALPKIRISDYETAVQRVIEKKADNVYVYTRDLIARLKAEGYFLIAISGSQVELVEPFAQKYGFDTWVGQQWERGQEFFTGNVVKTHTGKDVILKRLMNEHDLTQKDSYAVGDSNGDVGMLSFVDHPIAFNPTQELFDKATEHGWDIVVERKNLSTHYRKARMDHTYWRTQNSAKPLFPDLEWSKPERRNQAGRLGIVGGNKLGFAAVAESYSVALEAGIGNVRVVLPDVLKKTIPASMTDVVFAPTTPSGSLASSAADELQALAGWASGVLLIGDAGRNSETAVAYEKFISTYTGPLVITRDAIDLVKNSANLLVERPNTLLVASFAQTQKLFQNVYYPKMLTFSMHLQQLVDALHKFTVTYPITIVTLHRDQIIMAADGQVITQKFDEPMQIWRGTTATKATAYWLWNPSQALEAIAASVAS